MTFMLLDRRHVLAGLVATGVPIMARQASALEASWSWGVDYGPNSDPTIATGFDLLVLEPDHARPIAPLRGPMSRLLGYISLGEVERTRGFFGELRDKGVLRKANANWPDARMVDLRNPVWSSLVVDRLIPEILSKGYDGIFLDTMDNAEAMEREDPKGAQGMVAAAVELVRLIRANFPEIVVMLNRGYALLPQAAPYVDVVLGEAMASRWNFTDKKYELLSLEDWNWQANHLLGAKAANQNLKIATLDYWDLADKTAVMRLYSLERSAGFYPYVSTLALDRLYREPV